jgi:hypothetical protein
MTTPPKIFDDPEHWRNRAEEARTVAENMRDQVSRGKMLRIAADYDLMADRAAQRATLLKPKQPKEQP